MKNCPMGFRMCETSGDVCMNTGCPSFGPPAATLALPAEDANPKDIAGRAKPQMHLVPISEGVVRVMELGARKYGPYNWRDKNIACTVYISAAMRHLKKYLDGESIDPESGATHIEHAAAGLLILSDALAQGCVKDDRPTPAKAMEASK